MWIVTALAIGVGSGARAADAPKDQPKSVLTDPNIAKLSPDEKKTSAKVLLAEMKKSMDDVLRMVEESSSAQNPDTSRLDCLNPLLTNIKGERNVADSAANALDVAVAKKQEEEANHEYEKIDLASKRVAQLYADANACGGTSANGIKSGQTKTTEIIPPGLPADTTTTVSVAPPAVIAPPCASNPCQN